MLCYAMFAVEPGVMPNRIVREGIITSEPVNSLSWPEEVFYRRLHSVVDDFGRYHANLSLLRAACYPLRLNDVSDSDVGKWLAVCVSKGLVRVYEVEGKRFLEVIKFAQQVRAKTSKFPHSPLKRVAPTAQQISERTATAHLDGVVVGDEIEDEDDLKGARRNGSHKDLPEGFEIFWTAYPKRTGNNPKDRAVKAYRARVKEGSSPAEILDGAGRYAEFCRQTGKTGTEFVLQAATFLGPGKPFEQPWSGAAAPNAPDYSALQARLEKEERERAGV